MNPPTPGHLDLIRQLIEKAVEIDVQTVYLVLSKTNDNKDDPISCVLKKTTLVGTETKTIQNMVQILKWDMVQTNAMETKSPDKMELRAAKIQAVQVIPICVPDEPRSTPFTVIGKLIAYMRRKMEREGQTPNIHLFIMIGEDRAELADSISQFYYEKDVTIMSMNAHILERPTMKSYNLDEATMDELYDAIQQGIERLPPSKKKSSSKKTTQKGTYPKIKHIVTHELHSPPSRKRPKTGSPN
jgi:nicotinic acid mononucleotide adenylyltransferase